MEKLVMINSEPSKAFLEKVEDYLGAKAYVKTIAPTVIENCNRVLEKNCYNCNNEFAIQVLNKDRTLVPIVARTKDDLCFISERDFGDYNTKVRYEHIKSGIPVPNDVRHCPLLVAEEQEREAQREMVKEGLICFYGEEKGKECYNALWKSYKYYIEVSERFVQFALRGRKLALKES